MMDLLAAVIANYSVRKAVEPADEDHPYGHGKYENLSGVIEAILIFIAAGIILYEAANKLLHSAEVEFLELGIVVMGISVVTNILVSRYLYKVAKEEDSMALEADALHLKTDVWTSLGIFAGLIVIKITNLPLLDPIIAIGVAVMIIRAAWDMTKRSGADLLDERLSPEDEKVIRDALEKHSSKFLGYHSLRTRKAGSERFVDLIMVIKYNMTIDEGHQLAELVEKDIISALKSTSITIHLEPCDKDCCFQVNGSKVCFMDGQCSSENPTCYEREKDKGTPGTP
jgi:cation diffusion facilitator family transporter